MRFTEEEAKLISPFFTNIDKPVFALKNLPEVVKGALFARYSRTDKSLRRTLLDEFIKKPEMGFKEIVGFQFDKGIEEHIAIQKAEEFYDRVLVGFGDDSVAELGGAHLAIEEISQIATKFVEDSRLGLSPLEKSTRYVYFNEKENGEYKYYRDEELMTEFSDLYIETCDFLFDTYSKLLDPMRRFVVERFPQSDLSDRAYQSTVKAKTCDVLRILLPASALTNMGFFGNGRAFEYLLLKMYAHLLTEIRNLAMLMQSELNKVIPSFVKRADDKYGREQQTFIRRTTQEMENLVKQKMSEEVEPAKIVTLVDYDEDAVDKVVTAIIHSYSHHPLSQIKERVKNMSEEEKNKIIQSYLNKRTNRRHKPGRAFECTYYTFDILGNFGIYRDLHRHRILTQQRQLLTTNHGYDIPKEIVDAGMEDEFKAAMQQAKETFDIISKALPQHAQYVVPLAYKVRWYMKFNLREAFHLIELRTTPQGHYYYRKIAQEMFNQIKKIHPTFVENMSFVDMNEYELERLEAEKRLDKKIEEIKKKYG